MKFLPLLLAPTLSLAAVSGTVTMLDGTPIAGAVLKVGTDSVTTTAGGTFALARSAGISTRSGKTRSVTSHLTLENGHPRLNFAGFDLSGRPQSSVFDAKRSLSVPRAEPRDGVEGSRTTAARSSASRDTLRLYWKGKRLTVLPVPSDTTVTLRIDTAWDSDYGYLWDPTAEYGTLHDSRDGRVYRTLQIGAQTWMAENLRFTDPNGYTGGCYYADFSGKGGVCEVEGRLYGWSTLVGTDTIPGNVLHGICPTGWHVPSDTEWGTMLTLWHFSSMRIIFGGYIPSNQTLERYTDRTYSTRFWVSGGDSKWGHLYRGCGFSKPKGSSELNDGYSLRCVKDAP